MKDPKDLDKAICDWSMSTGYSLTDRQQTTLMAKIFNSLWPDGNIHTMPNCGEHLETKLCWCGPLLDYKNEESGKEHWVHTETRKEALQ